MDTWRCWTLLLIALINKGACSTLPMSYSLLTPPSPIIICWRVRSLMSWRLIGRLCNLSILKINKKSACSTRLQFIIIMGQIKDKSFMIKKIQDFFFLVPTSQWPYSRSASKSQFFFFDKWYVLLMRKLMHQTHRGYTRWIAHLSTNYAANPVTWTLCTTARTLLVFKQLNLIEIIIS